MNINKTPSFHTLEQTLLLLLLSTMIITIVIIVYESPSKEQTVLTTAPIGESQKQATQTQLLEMKQELMTGVQELKHMFQLASFGYQKSFQESDEHHLQQLKESNERRKQQLEPSYEQHQQFIKRYQQQLQESSEILQQQFQEQLLKSNERHQQQLQESSEIHQQQLHELNERHKIQIQVSDEQHQQQLQEQLLKSNERHQQQLQETNERHQQQIQESNERHQQSNERYQEQLKESNEQHQQQFQELHMLIEGVRQDNQQLHELTRKNEEMENTIQQQDEELHDLRAKIEDPPWLIKMEEIEVTREVIGRGGWGEVKIGIFRGTRVAVKCLHDLILSDYNISLFSREMDIASRVRHPNLLQFIGATRFGNPMILTELMPTSLRKEMDKKALTHPQILSISRDIVSALNYLHLWRPEPILHRDVASPNVLLEPSGNNQWKGKLSDYGSANLQHQISTTVGPGNPAYAAPESRYPNDHSPTMDVYSFGVLLMEMVVHRPPPPTTREKEGLIRTIEWVPMKTLIKSCIQEDKDQRPKTSNVLEQLYHL